MSIMDLKKNAPKGEFLAYINKKEAAMLKKAGGSGKLVNGIPSFRPQDRGQEAKSKEKGFDQTDTSNPYSNASKTAQAAENKDIAARHAQRQRDAIKEELSITPFNRNKVLNKFQFFYNNFQKNQNKKVAKKRAFDIAKKLGKYVHGDTDMDYDFTQDIYGNKIGKGLEFLTSNKGTSIESKRKNLYSVNSNIPGTFGTFLNPVFDNIRPDTQVTLGNAKNLMRDYNMLSVDPNISRNKLEKLANRGKLPEQIKTGGGDVDSIQPFMPIDYNTGAASVEAVEPYTNDFTYRFGDNQNVGRNVTDATYAADGGIMGTRAKKACGGIMDRVDKRQGYIFGGITRSISKAVKGVAKAAGKVLKSDAGKMALLAAGAYYTGGGSIMGYQTAAGKAAGGFGKTAFMSNLGKIGTYAKENPFKTIGFASTVLPFLAGGAKPNEDIGMADRGGRLQDSQGNDALPADLRAEVQEAYASGDSDRIKQIQNYYSFLPPTNQYLPYPNYAEGGRINKAEGGLMDLGGMEKDYRNDGGFVPIGEYEKKDDVPARLSVNEFVFTADAVRGAGGGDIDKGAEIMENVMKN